MSGKADTEGVSYELLCSHGGDWWVRVAQGGETSEQMIELAEALITKSAYDAPKWAVQKVTRERVEFTPKGR